MERKGYTTITKELSGLSLNEIWIYSIIKSFRKKDGYSDLTYKQIAFYSGISEKTVEKIMPNLIKNSNLFSCVSKANKVGSREQNVYHFAKSENYFFVNNKFFENPNKDKAILLLIKCFCINNTNDCKYSINKLSDLTGLNKRTLSKYIKEAINNDLLSEDLTIKDKNILTGVFKKNSVKEINEYNYKVIKDFCQSKGVEAPFKDDKLMGYITGAYTLYDNSLKKSLENRCKSLPEKVSLLYFIKVLRNINVEPKKEETIIL